VVIINIYATGRNEEINNKIIVGNFSAPLLIIVALVVNQ
jgi:hypothetical protein